MYFKIYLASLTKYPRVENRRIHQRLMLYIDFIDDYNQALSFRGTINDNVSGYTLPQIEGFLSKIYGFYSLSQQLKANKPYYVTNEQIDELLSQF